MPKRTTSRIVRARNTVLLNGGAVPHPVVHRGRPDMPPAPTPRISAYVTVTWAWNGSPSGGNITWTFVNADTANSHAVVLYRGGAETPTYIFGGAFWPIYLAGGFGTSMLDGTQPIPTLKAARSRWGFSTSVLPLLLGTWWPSFSILGQDRHTALLKVSPRMLVPPHFYAMRSTAASRGTTA